MPILKRAPETIPATAQEGLTLDDRCKRFGLVDGVAAPARVTAHCSHDCGHSLERDSQVASVARRLAGMAACVKARIAEAAMPPKLDSLSLILVVLIVQRRRRFLRRLLVQPRKLFPASSHLFRRWESSGDGVGAGHGQILVPWKLAQ